MSPFSRFPLFLTLFLSTLSLTFFYFLVSLYTSVESGRSAGYSNVHMTIVFKGGLPHQKIDALMGRIVQVSGPNSGNFLDSKDVLAKFSGFPDANLVRMVWGQRKIFLLNISLGRGPNGQPVYLEPQISAIRSILKDDQDVLLIQANESWARQLDRLDRIMRRTKRIGAFFVGAGLVSLVFFWAIYLGVRYHDERTLGTNLTVEDEPEDRRRAFWADPDSETPEVPQDKDTATTMRSPLLSGSMLGISVGVLSVAMIWFGHPFLYPEGLDPFTTGKGLSEGDRNHLMLFSLPAVGGVMGWLSGFVSRLFSFSR
jgi:hypothetical protein